MNQLSDNWKHKFNRNFDYSYERCTCNKGFTGNGIACTDVNECDMGACGPGDTCKNLIGTYRCQQEIQYQAVGTTEAPQTDVFTEEASGGGMFNQFEGIRDSSNYLF